MYLYLYIRICIKRIRKETTDNEIFTLTQDQKYID